jgi:hypothetical protein
LSTPGRELAAAMLIEVGSKDEAECVAAALENFGSELENAGRRWRVIVQDDVELVPLIPALEDCLRDNRIPSVKVSVGNRKYVMQILPGQTA